MYCMVKNGHLVVDSLTCLADWPDECWRAYSLATRKRYARLVEEGFTCVEVEIKTVVGETYGPPEED